MGANSPNISGMSEGLLRQYLDGQLSPVQRHFVERNLLESEMWADIYEGMQAMDENSIDAQAVQSGLEAQLAKRIAEEEHIIGRPANRFPIRKIGLMAASVVGLIAVAAVSLNYLNNTTFQQGGVSAKQSEAVVSESDFSGDEIEIMDYVSKSKRKRQRNTNRDVVAMKEGETPEDLQYESSEAIKEVASRKRLASGEAKLLFAEVDNKILKSNGYRQLEVVDANDWERLRQIPSAPVISNSTPSDGFYAGTSSPKPEVAARTAQEVPPLLADQPELSRDNDTETRSELGELDAATDDFGNADEVIFAEESLGAEEEAVVSAQTTNADKELADIETAKQAPSRSSTKKRDQKLFNPYAKRKKEVQAEVIKANTIAGNITDANGDPILGASVTVRGKDIGVITGMEGEYELNGVEEGDEVVISMVGMETITAKAKMNEENYFVLEEDSDSLSEVVVTGYGRNSKPYNAKREFERFLAEEAENFQQQQSSPESGRVVLQVILDENGMVSASKVTKGMTTEYNEHAQALVKEAARTGSFDGWTIPNKPFIVRVKFKN